MQKKLIVLQDGFKECGSAALLSIIRYYKGNISMSRLLELTKTDKNGTNFYQLKEAAREIGLDSKSYKVNSLEELIKLDCPCICQIINNNYNHFVVVYKINNKKVIIMDPARGKVIMSKDDFDSLFTGYIMIFNPFKKLLFFTPNKQLNNLILNIIINNKSFIINIFLLSVLFTIFTCLYSFYFKVIIDNVLTTNYSNLIIITLIFAIIIIFKCLTNYLRNYLLMHLNQKIDLSIILHTFNKVLRLPYHYYKNKTTGEVISRINDLAYIKNMLSQIIITVFLDLIVSIVGGIILFNINKVMFLILVVIMFIYIALLYLFRPFIKKMTNINQENNALINSFLVESISGFETVKGLNIEKIMERKMEKLYTNALNNNLSYEKISNVEMFLKDIVNYLGLLIVTFIGCKFIMDGELTIGTLVTFNSLLVYFLDPIRNIIDLNKDYYLAVNSLKRANNLLEIESEKLDKTSGLELKNSIEFKNVDFNFNGKDNILNNVNFKINSSEKVLILGPSGSGKSTILKLIYKYYDITRNNIYLDDVDINDYYIEDIRKQISYISQNEVLYTMSIKDNILLDREIKYDDFINVCKLTYVDEIASNCFLGYDTLLEENGVNLSGGQRQRIVLARTLLKNSKIILIDEGLNEIDINLERKILKNIFDTYQDKIIIVVSHRLDNMDLYNKVVKLEKGSIMDVIKKC